MNNKPQDSSPTMVSNNNPTLHSTTRVERPRSQLIAGSPHPPEVRA